MKTPVTDLLRFKGAALASVTPAATVADAVAAMIAQRAGSVLVVEEGSLAGIFTERDVLTRVVARGLDPRATPVSQVMTRRAVTIPPETTVAEAMAIITEKRCRHLPVLRGGDIIGLVSAGDLMRHISTTHATENHSLKQILHEGYPS